MALRGGTQGALFRVTICFGFCLVLHSPTQSSALVFQLPDLEEEENGAQVGECGSAPQLCQPCFQGDPTLGNDHF